MPMRCSALPGRAKTAAFIAQAHNRQAMAQTRRAEFKAAIATATAALRAAHRSRQTPLIAQSLFRLAEAQMRENLTEQSIVNATRSAELFEHLGDTSGHGRALWTLAAAQSNLGHAAEADRAASRALELCRSCGDLYGTGNALNLLTFNEANHAVRLKKLGLALADFKSAGYVERQQIVTYNLALGYHQLGLNRHARRLLLLVLQRANPAALHSEGGVNLLSALAEVERALGHLDSARTYIARIAAIAEARPHAVIAAKLAASRGQLALREGEAAKALRHFEHARRLAHDGARVAAEIDLLGSIGQARLALGNPRAALAATRRATALHRAHDLAALDGMAPAETWWRHAQALRANKQAPAAREALAMAYQFMLQGIASLSDEGLRRNYLNKIDAHREIVAAWLEDARKRRLSPQRRTAHLAGEANLSEPFERLVDTGLRLNELRSTAELHEFLIDEATELSGAERVLLVLETPNGLQLAGSLVPRGEDAHALLRDVTPALVDVRRTRAVSLTYGPEGASELEQRSRVIAPLIAQRQLLGYLYADLDGRFGRLRESDRDMLGMLASQAAVALDNAQWSQDLEQKVAQRTEELQASNALIEQRANELAIINSIQEGMAAELNFQAIVDLVGDKLVELFGAGTLVLGWLDEQAGLIRLLYACEHGMRRKLPPVEIAAVAAGKRYYEAIAARQAVLWASQAEYRAWGLFVAEGTEMSRSGVLVPIFASDRTLGFISLENMERDNAYGDADVRLLSTVGASMGVALENARLFDETQRRTRETAALAEIGRDISSTLDLPTVMDRIARHAKDLTSADNSAIFLPDPDGQTYRAIVAIGDMAEALQAAVIEAGAGIIGNLMQSGHAEFINDTGSDARAIQIAGTPKLEHERLMVAPLMAGRTRQRRDGRLANGRPTV